jgi:hypothetical protein
LTARQAARLLVSREEALQGWQKEMLLHLGKADQEIERMTRDVSRFLQMLRHLQGNHLDTWLDEIEAHGVAELRSFAQGLRKDYPAVKATEKTDLWASGVFIVTSRILHHEEKLTTKARKGQ